MFRLNCFLFLLVTMNPIAFAGSFVEPADAVESYITGVSSGSGAHITAAYADNAEIQYYDQNGDYQYFSRDSFAEVVNSGNQWDARIEITNMLVTGRAANATVEFTWGANGENGYVDYLNLIKTDAGWTITNKVAQYIQRD